MRVVLKYKLAHLLWGIAFSVLCQAVMAEPANAGAWNPKGGDGQIILTTLWSNADQIFGEDGQAQGITSFTKTESRIFGEFGLTDRWALTGNAAYQSIEFQSDQSRFGFKDFDQTELGLRYQLKRRKGLAISVQGSYIWDGGPQDNILDIGSPQDQIELRGLWGMSVEDTGFGDLFFDVQVAGRMDTDGRYDATHLDLALGYKPSPKWMIMLQNYGAVTEAESDFGFRVPRQSRLKMQGSVTYHWKKRQSVQLGYVETVWGENIVREGGLTLGFWWRF